MPEEINSAEMESQKTDAEKTETQKVDAHKAADAAPKTDEQKTEEKTDEQKTDAPAAAADVKEAEPAVPFVPKVIIVTGASAGIGYEVARALCEKGHDVILACRSEERANRCIDKIKKQNPNALATYMQLDLASLESVRKFAEDFRATEKKLSVLINNAGLAQGMKDTKRQFTKDNFELTMGTNHLGHFLLTSLLLDDLKQSAKDGLDARVVVVTSSMHDVDVAKKRGSVHPLDVDNLFLANEGTYTGLQAYKNSKLANILFTYELSRQLEGSGVKVNAICPGFVPTTELLRTASGATKFFCRYVLHGMLRHVTKATRTVQQACTGVCALALDEKYKDVSGKFFRDGAEAKSSEESMDEEKQKKIWALSAGYTHLPGYEPLDAPPPPVEEIAPPPEAKQEEPAAANGDVAAQPTPAAAEEKDEKKAESEEAKETEKSKEEPKSTEVAVSEMTEIPGDVVAPVTAGNQEITVAE